MMRGYPEKKIGAYSVQDTAAYDDAAGDFVETCGFRNLSHFAKAQRSPGPFAAKVRRGLRRMLEETT